MHRLPSHIVEALAKLAAVREQLKAELMRDPTPEEMEAKSGIPQAKATEWLAMAAQPASLESTVMDDDNATEMKDMLVVSRQRAGWGRWLVWQVHKGQLSGLRSESSAQLAAKRAWP